MILSLMGPSTTTTRAHAPSPPNQVKTGLHQGLFEPYVVYAGLGCVALALLTFRPGPVGQILVPLREDAEKRECQVPRADVNPKIP